MREERQVRVALARWGVIAAATDERLTPTERGQLLAEIAAQVHRDADGRPFRVTKRTLYRWLAAWQRAGFEGLKPQRRRDAGTHETDADVLEFAAALRREAPARSAAHIAELLARTRGVQVGPDPAAVLRRQRARAGPAGGPPPRLRAVRSRLLR
jgi:putative transposase